METLILIATLKMVEVQFATESTDFSTALFEAILATRVALELNPPTFFIKALRESVQHVPSVE